MVFYYNIRGGQCRNEHSTIVLQNTDIICYVGRDKHENEFLIKYGWPSDIWFHVEGLSSAHVYFRIKISKSSSGSSEGDSDSNNASSSSSQLLSKLLAVNGNDITNLIPIDNIPLESIEDMCQIVKHNSISGCKMASCRIVYTPHSNLKKTFEMESGAVTYHNFKLQRFQRCDKDRQRIKELEKTKVERNNVQYFDEMKTNERLLIDLRKIYKRSSGGSGSGTAKVDIYDPMAEDMRETKSKATRQGDNLSGLDSGLSNLESLGLVAIETTPVLPTGRGGGERRGGGGGKNDPSSSSSNNNNNNNNKNNNNNQDDLNIPIWQKEYNERIEKYNDNERTLFLLTRGYTISEINTVMDDDSSISDNVESFSITLAKLWNTVLGEGGGEKNNDKDNEDNEEVTKEQLYESRYEEREVLEAIYGEDEHVQFGWKNQDSQNDDDSDDDDASNDDDDEDEDEEDIDPTQPFNFDSIFPITGYEPPTRYEYPPPLLLEIYVDNQVSLYPYNKQSPVLALVGGGIPIKYLRRITKKLHQVTIERSNEAEDGEPYLFDLLNLINDFTIDVLEEENIEIEKQRKQAMKKAKDDAIKVAAAAAAAAAKAKAKAKEDGNEEDEEEDDDTDTDTDPGELKFKSDADRRAYAQSIVSRGLGSGGGGMGAFDSDKNKPKQKTKQDYSDDAAAARLQEINDLFG
jgi:hypothetical protein